MKPIHIALFCFAAAMALNFSPSFASLSIPPGFSETYKGTTYYGTPEQIHYFKQVSDLVDHFDQEIWGRDTPAPKRLIIQENLYSGGQKIWGLAQRFTGLVKVEARAYGMMAYRILFHERLHLTGLTSAEHDQIFQLEEQFEQLLISYGY